VGHVGARHHRPGGGLLRAVCMVSRMRVWHSSSSSSSKALTGICGGVLTDLLSGGVGECGRPASSWGWCMDCLVLLARCESERRCGVSQQQQ
jgi:hypothetical protein